jgi:hypothetical protein
VPAFRLAALTLCALLALTTATGCADEGKETVTAKQGDSASGSPAPTVDPAVPGGGSASAAPAPAPGAAGSDQGGTKAPAKGGPPAPTPAGSGSAELKVSVAGGKVTPKAGARKVKKGQRVKLVVMSDKADEIHVHGYEKTIKINPNVATVVEFTASMPGKWEVELHEQEIQLLQLQVQ